MTGSGLRVSAGFELSVLMADRMDPIKDDPEFFIISGVSANEGGVVSVGFSSTCQAHQRDW